MHEPFAAQNEEIAGATEQCVTAPDIARAARFSVAPMMDWTRRAGFLHVFNDVV